MATQGHAWAVAHRSPAVAGQAVPAFFLYMGAQPVASSALRLLKAGSQSSDWFWLPPATRISTIGSLTDEAFSRLPLTPIRTTRSCVQLVWTELQRSSEFAPSRPFSEILASMIGPDRSELAPKTRWMTPNVPLHLLPPPVLQVSPPR